MPDDLLGQPGRRSFRDPARRACIGAMDGRVDPSVAAEAFKTEAGLLRQ
jgi:hypothetical protein